MKRFIDLGNQTKNIDYDNGEREFAFYCTVTDRFESFSGNQTWESIESFTEDYDGKEDITRYLGLIPKNFFN